MKRRLCEDELSRLSECITKQVGLNYPRERWSDMEREIQAAAGDFEFADVHACVEWLLASPLSKHQVEVLARHLTVGETYFFREKPSFEFFGKHILPELLRLRTGGRRIRIWSAGCASGEEPYSIAILLDRLAGKEAPRRASILATDINPRALAKAEEGVYGDWSFRGVPPSLKQTYFRPEGRRYRIRQRIRKQVWFSYLNLAEDAYPSLPNGTNAMDVIFCRNVLMYFSPRQARKVVRKFHRALVEGGWLLVSPCEASPALLAEFTPHHYPGIIVYRKQSPAAAGTAPEWFSLPRSREPAPPAESGLAPPSAAEDSPAPPPRDLVAAHAGNRQGPQGAWSCEKAEDAQREARQVPLAGATQPSPNVPHISGSGGDSLAAVALALANQGRLAEAMAQCERAIETNKLHSSYHYLKATILLEQGACEEARQALKRTVYLDPDFVLAYLSLSNLARQQNDGAASRRYLRIVQRLLSTRDREERLPEWEGMTAGRLLEIVEAQLDAPGGGKRRLEAP